MIKGNTFSYSNKKLSSNLLKAANRINKQTRTGQANTIVVGKEVKDKMDETIRMMENQIKAKKRDDIIDDLLDD